MKKRKEVPEVNFMSLKFFARHFNFPIKALQWGIVKWTIKEASEAVCAVLVKGGLLYIDILENKIRQSICINTTLELIPCELLELDNMYIFHSEGCSLSLEKEIVTEFYADKFFSKATEKYMLGAYAELLYL